MQVFFTLLTVCFTACVTAANNNTDKIVFKSILILWQNNYLPESSLKQRMSQKIMQKINKIKISVINKVNTK